MDFYKKIKSFVIFLIIFAWVFSGSFQIWNNPSIPPEIQEVKAETAYYDPISDVAAGWTCTGATCGTGHYTVLDDGIRQPDAPGTSDYVSATSNSGASNEEHQINSITQSGINYLRLYYYAGTGARANINIMLQSGGDTKASYTLTPDSSAAWRYVQWDTSSVGTITGEFAISDSGTGKPGNGTVYAWYIEVNYTPPVSNLSISSTGTQTSTMLIPSSNNHVGGAFTFVSDGSSGNQAVSQIIISETGTVDADANLSNVKLFYKQEATCSSSIPGDASTFNSTGVSFSSSKATATGSMSVGTSQICVYVQLDVGSGSSANDTLLIQITDSSTEVTVDTGTVSPDTPVAISGTTTLASVTLTVSSTGTQTSAMSIPSSDNYVGGAFTFVSNSSQTVSEIIVSDTGTVNANSNISNLKIRYETAGTCTYNGDETLFNSTGVSFDASEQATATGTMAISTSQVCVYVILDVGSGASQDQTLLIQITDPSTEVTVNTGVASPVTPVAISGTTTLEAPDPNVHINTSGTQKETLGIPSSDNYLGGVFALIQNETGLGAVNVTQIIISETGTVDADADLSNLRLFYKQEATCATSSIPIDATAFNSSGVSFSSSEATVTGTMSIGESQVCLYIQLDIGSGASPNETIEIQIDSSSDVTVSDGTVSLQSTPLAIAGITTLQAIISITINPSSFDYGLSSAGGTRRAINSAGVPDLGNYGILVTNNTVAPVDLYIYGNDATGDETWTLSAGALQYTHEFIKLDINGNPVGNWTTLDYSANKKILETDVAASSTMEFDLQITTPGSSEIGTIVSVPVTVLATETGG